MQETLALVSEIVRRTLGERPRLVEHVPTLEDSDVFKIYLDGSVAYFKAEHEGHPIDVLAWAYRKAASVSVPTPEVLHVDTSLTQWPREFVLIAQVDGSDLEREPLTHEQLGNAVEQLGRVVAHLHSVPLDGFGDLAFTDPSASDPVGAFADHASNVRATLHGWSFPYVTEHRLIGAETADRVREVITRHDELIGGLEQGVLVHDDLALEHVFVERDTIRITGLIDFEPRSSDPMWDLAVFAFQYPHLAPHLLRGYGGTYPDDVDRRLDFYGLIRALGTARWEHEKQMSIERALREIDRLSAKLTRALSC